MNQCDNPLGAGNQQERSILSLDFLAGLIVGEGSYFIGIRRQKKPAGYYVTLYPGFGMRMNDKDTVDMVCRSFEAHGLDLYRNTAVYKRCIGVSVIGLGQMRRHLDVFLPLLTGNKKRAAEIVSEFTDSRLANTNRRYDNSDIDLLERLREINGPSRARLPIEILRDYTSSSPSTALAGRYSPTSTAT